MGSKTYDYLTESLLFDSSLIHDQFKSVSEEDLKRELRSYREFCLSSADELEREVVQTRSNLKVFAGVNHTPLSLLKQSAFYIHQYVLYDPLFALTQESSEHNQTFNTYF